MNKEHWKKFYQEAPPRFPSDFACLCYPLIPKHSRILDVGAGDGSDDLMLKDRGSVLAIEPNTDAPGSIDGVMQFVGSFEDYIRSKPEFIPEVIYARFFLHAVEEEVEAALLRYAEVCKATLMLEFRAKGDVVPDDGHTRRPIDPFDLVNNLITERGYIIKYFDVDHDLSIYGDSNPYLARVIAEYKGR